MANAQYLSAEYRLQPVEQPAYESQAARVAAIKRLNPLEQTLKIVMSGEEPDMIPNIHAYAEILRDAYSQKVGGGFYALSLAVGVAALRQANPEVPGVSSEDWEQAISRDEELLDRDGVETLEAIAGIGMLEIRAVNPGYVDGYQETYATKPKLEPILGFTGLGSLYAHDLMHFASLRA